MPQLRKDPLSDCWIVIAEDREQRPDEFERTPRRRVARDCPFCGGREEQTPPPIAVYTADSKSATTADPGARTDGPDRTACGVPALSQAEQPWLVRVVPNKYPALIEAEPAPPRREGFYQWTEAAGRHEVIIESPRHVASLTELTEDECRTLMTAYRDRIRILGRDPRLRYVLIFKNVGSEAGASLEHSHSQLMATGTVPVVVERELSGARRWYEKHGECFYCQMLRYERKKGVRTAGESKFFQAICPFASRMPFETWILPRDHMSRFETQEDEPLADLAKFLQELIRKLERTHPHVAYNYFIHTAPFDTSKPDHYHWHVEIFPRLTTTAGFEWGAGYFINPVPPEEAAAIFRT